MWIWRIVLASLFASLSACAHGPPKAELSRAEIASIQREARDSWAGQEFDALRENTTYAVGEFTIRMRDDDSLPTHRQREQAEEWSRSFRRLSSRYIAALGLSYEGDAVWLLVVEPELRNQVENEVGSWEALARGQLTWGQFNARRLAQKAHDEQTWNSFRGAVSIQPIAQRRLNQLARTQQQRFWVSDAPASAVR
jgi:hypothetical protein